MKFKWHSLFQGQPVLCIAAWTPNPPPHKGPSLIVQTVTRTGADVKAQLQTFYTQPCFPFSSIILIGFDQSVVCFCNKLWPMRCLTPPPPPFKHKGYQLHYSFAILYTASLSVCLTAGSAWRNAGPIYSDVLVYIYSLPTFWRQKQQVLWNYIYMKYIVLFFGRLVKT